MQLPPFYGKIDNHYRVIDEYRQLDIKYVATEKIHGTSGIIAVLQASDFPDMVEKAFVKVGNLIVCLGTHHRWLSPSVKDGHQMYAWGMSHLEELKSFATIGVDNGATDSLALYVELYGLRVNKFPYGASLDVAIFDIAALVEELDGWGGYWHFWSWENIVRAADSIRFASLLDIYPVPTLELLEALEISNERLEEISNIKSVVAFLHEVPLADAPQVEGCVFRPALGYKYDPNAGSGYAGRVIFKYKNPDFREVEGAATKKYKDKQASENFFGREFLNKMRVDHVVSKLESQGVKIDYDVTDLSTVIRAVIDDVIEEEGGTVPDHRAFLSRAGKIIAGLYKNMLAERYWSKAGNEE